MVTVVHGRFGADGRAIARSDESGRFQLWTKPGPLWLSARAEGYGDSSTQGFAPSSKTQLFMTPESILVGRVVHAQTGEPVADVTVSSGGGRWNQGRGDDVRSDAEGNFRIRGLHPGVYKPEARSDNFYGVAATQVHLGLGQTSEPIELRVHPVAFVEGRIVRAGTDEVCQEGTVTLLGVSTKERVTGQTDEEGHVILRGVLPGEYEVEVGCVGLVAQAEYPKLVVASENLIEQVWEVREGQTIRGVVVDSEGQPVAKMGVNARMQIDGGNARAQSTFAWAGESELDGSFELAGLLPGKYELGVWGDRPRPKEPSIVDLEPGIDRNDVRIELPGSGSIHGRVVDDHGLGQANVEVESGLIGEWKESQSRTDDEGNFTIEHVRAGEVRVSASADRWGQSLRRPGSHDDDEQGEVVTVVSGETVEVELVVEGRSGVIRGRVLDEDGAPVDDAFIQAERMSDSATANKARSRNSVRWDWGNSQPHLSEIDGSFVLEDLSEGTYVVRAHRKGGGEAIVEDVALGSEVELTIAPTGVLAGKIEVPGGKPPERFSIAARDDAAGLSFDDKYFRTEGEWALHELPAGKYTLTVDSSAGVGELVVELVSGGKQEDLVITLQPRVTIKGRLIDADTRAPVPGMKVSISVGSGGWSFNSEAKPGSEISDEQGQFEVADAPTGKVRIMITPRDFGLTSDYSWNLFNRTIATEPAIQDLGDITLIADRLEPGQTAGDIGFELAQTDPGLEPEQLRHTVGLVRPGGPAEASGIAVGDVIKKVEGKSVVGEDYRSYWKLVAAPQGTVIALGLASGKSVSIELGPPRD